MKLRSKKPPINLAEKLKEAVSVSVAKALRADASRLSIVRTNCAPIARLVRKKLTFRRLWGRQIQPMLAEASLLKIVQAEMKRQSRIAADAAQLALPGFENLPKRLHAERRTVREYLALIDRRQKRAQRNQPGDQEALRLADLIRDQPPDLTVPEAVARAAAAKGAAAK
jgi:hypothetical protein